MYAEIKRYLEELPYHKTSRENKKRLQPLIDYMYDCLHTEQTIKLHFICTHNSRRSHLSQVWAQIAAAYHGFHVMTYSGGTEATAIYPKVIETLGSAGLEVILLHECDNPMYAFKYSDHHQPILAFSKVYDHPICPDKKFAAVMTCGDADDNCPAIPGVQARIPITYTDPKVSDGTSEQSAVYAERSKQIATDMMLVFDELHTLVCSASLSPFCP